MRTVTMAILPKRWLWRYQTLVGRWDAELVVWPRLGSGRRVAVIKQLLAWVSRFWEVLFYLPPERVEAHAPVSGPAQNSDHVGLLI
jgi:hypothetical protein